MTDYQQNNDDDSNDEESESSKKLKVDDESQIKPVKGIWLLSSTGKVKPLGAIGHLGAIDELQEGNPTVEIVANSAGTGYWIVFANGQVTPIGTTTGFEEVNINEGAVVAAGATSDTGLILALSTGSVKALGTAEFLGSAIDMGLASPVTDIAVTKSGYWLLTQSGRVINFGETIFYESATDIAEQRSANAVSIAAHPKGDGYWIALSDGFVVPCGRAIFHGRIEEPEAPIVSIISNHDGNGYWLIDATGNVFPFGEIGGFDAFGETVEGFTGQIVSATPVT